MVRYNVFKARILVRHAKDGKLYLYDILRIKKETSKPLEQFLEQLMVAKIPIKLGRRK